MIPIEKNCSFAFLCFKNNEPQSPMKDPDLSKRYIQIFFYALIENAVYTGHHDFLLNETIHRLTMKL
jgi:hypothetical protein